MSDTLQLRPCLETDEQIEAAATQFVWKVSGFTKLSKVNEDVFEMAIYAILDITRDLMEGLVSSAPSKNRDVEVEKARERNRKLFSVVN